MRVTFCAAIKLRANQTRQIVYRGERSSSARASNTSSGLRYLDKKQRTAVLIGQSRNAGCVAAPTEMEVAFLKRDLVHLIGPRVPAVLVNPSVTKADLA